MPKLTKRTVESVRPDPDHEVIVWDSDLPGFGVRVWPSGKRTYILKYRTRDGRQRKATIGRHGPLTPGQARNRALKWLSEAKHGRDPAGEEAEIRRAPTVDQLAERYMEQHARPKKKAASIEADQRSLKLHILRKLGRKKVNSITRADIAQLHYKMREKPIAANRALALLSKMFNLAERWGLRSDGSNPCRHIERYKEHRVERFLSNDELAHLGEVLTEAERTGTELPSAIAAIRLLLFTGCRRSEILTLKWEYVDFERQCLRLPESKTGAKTVYLSPPALEVLTGTERQEGNPYVIKGAKPGSHLVNLTKPWMRIRARATVHIWAEHPDEQVSGLIETLTAKLGREPTCDECRKAADFDLPTGLLNVRLHDLRHSFASVAVAGGLSLPLIGALLGHTQPQTTARYAHLAADPLRQATELVGRRIAAAMDPARGTERDRAG